MTLGLLIGALIVASLVAIVGIFVAFAGVIVATLRRPDPETLLRRELDHFLEDLLGSPSSRV